MTWPTAPSTTDLPSSDFDSGLDSPAAARLQLLTMKAQVDDLSEKLAAVIGHGDPAVIPEGRLLEVRKFTSTSVYTKTPGTRFVIVKAVGGGAGGAGVSGANAGLSDDSVTIGSGGTSGAYAEGLFTSGFDGVTVTIGVAGPGGPAPATLWNGSIMPNSVTNNPGTIGAAGGTTSFGALLSCPGGLGGKPSVSLGAAPAYARLIQGTPSLPAGGNLIALPQRLGMPGFGLWPQPPAAGIDGEDFPNTFAGSGGDSPFGLGAIGPIAFIHDPFYFEGVDAAPTSYGAGGSGAVAYYRPVGTGRAAGGSGAPGALFVYEYS